jgi:DNA polymerase-3 subunit beta
MRFIANQALLQEALSAAMSAVPSKSTLQILNNFLLTLEGNVLEIGATDLDLGIRLKIEVQGMGDGVIVVNARKLLDVVRTQNQPNIELVVDNYLVRLLSGSNRTNMTGNDPSEFPDLEEVASGGSFSMNSSELMFLTEKTMFAVSNDVTRLALNGVYLHKEDEKLVFAATDGHRLGRAHLEIPQVTEASAIIPPKVLGHLLKVISADTPVEVSVGEKHIAFASENIRLVSKLLDGPYPRYQNVIPASFERIAMIQRDVLMDVVQRVGVVAHPRTHQIRLAFTPEQLEISTTNQDLGADSSESLPVQFQGEAPFRISFNAQYFLEILRKCPTDQVRLRMNTNLGAALVEPDGTDIDYFFLIMPLRLNED